MPKSFGIMTSFRTKAGICVVEDDTIMLHRTGIRGVMASGIAKLWAALGIQPSIDAIPIAAIKRVESTPALPTMTRAYFTVYFQRKGEIQKRLIILPGAWGGGSEAHKLALETFTNAGIVVDTN